jgi:hypothetical protein
MSCPQAFGSRRTVHAAQLLTEPRRQFIAHPDKPPASRDHINPGDDKQVS